MNKRDSRGYWVMTVPVISESHLTEEVAVSLVETLPGELFHDRPCMIGSHGALVYCHDAETLPEDAPSCLRDALEWAKREGLEWVRFDEDGDVIEGLAVYDW